MVSNQDASAPSERDYNKAAELARALAARAKTTEVTAELMALARRYEQLAEFSKTCVAALLSRIASIEQLRSGGTEAPAPSADGPASP